MRKLSAISLLLAGSALTAAEGPVFHWLFEPGRMKGKEILPVVGNHTARFSGTARIENEEGPPHVALSGVGHRVWVADDLKGLSLPKDEITVVAWVKVGRPLRWGGICGVIQDNGSYERGWVLGYENLRFNFGLNSEGTEVITYLKDSVDYAKGLWHHVAGVYDGAEMRLYVNGKLRVTSAAQKGAIRYPPRPLFELGAYHDDDEFYRLTGGLHEAAVWSRALSGEEIGGLFNAKADKFPLPPQPLEITGGPFVNWMDRSTVRLEWETETPMSARVVFRSKGGHKLEGKLDNPSARKSVMVRKLLPDAEYTYRIHAKVAGGKNFVSKPFSFDSSFYYRLPDKPAAPSPFPKDELAGIVESAAKSILDSSGIRKGYCLVLGSAEGRLAYELARRTDLQVVVVEPDAAKAQAARASLNKAGLYGIRASVHHGGLDDLPYGPYFANLIVSGSLLMDGKLPGKSGAELLRVLRPAGGKAVLGFPRAGSGFGLLLKRWLGAARDDTTVNLNLGWSVVTRGKLKGAGDWTHQYGSADNTTNSRDDLVRGEMGILWWGEPGPRPMPDRGGRNPAPLAANGRLFVQGDRTFFGMDAYNGSILWTLSAPEIRRSNLPRDGSNMAASDDFLYLAGGRHALGIDAQTGERRLSFSAPKGRHWGYMGVVGNQLIGTSVKPRSAYVADNGQWYNSVEAQDIARLVSDAVFSFNRRTGKRQWEYKGGLVMNSTITVADGVVYFVESRNPDAGKLPTSRLSPSVLNKQHLVALDLVGGRKLWEKPVDFSKCETMLYLLFAKGTLVVSGSKAQKYHTYAYDVSSPALRFAEKPLINANVPLLWKKEHGAGMHRKQPDGSIKITTDHGGLIQHPLVVQDVVYTDNRAYAIRSGKLLREDLPQRKKCGNMAASNHSMFFRHFYHGIWDLETDERIELQGIRSGCWIGIIPAQGLMLAPESSSGCSCTHSIQTSAAWVPRTVLKKSRR